MRQYRIDLARPNAYIYCKTRSTTGKVLSPIARSKLEAIANISASFELLCLASGMEALGEMMEHDAQAICGRRHARGPFRRAHRWGKAKGKIGFHGGNIEIERPRLRSFEGKEQALPSWEASVAEDWLGNGRFGCPQETFRRLWGLVCRNRPPPGASWHCRRHA